MKKIIMILFVFLFAIFNIPQYKAFAEDEEYLKVLFNDVNIFTETNVNSDTNTILFTANYGDVLKLINDDVINGQDGLKYYAVEVSQENVDEGYVLASYVCLAKYSSPLKQLDANATVSSDAKVFFKQDQVYTETDYVIKSGSAIKIIDGYDSSKVYTRIQYKLESGEIATNYIETSKIKTSGISRSTIGAIIIIITTVSLVLVIFGIKGRHKKTLKKIITGEKS